MSYWQCVNGGGHPYTYCGTNQICCVYGGDEDLSFLNTFANITNNKVKTSNCGRKGFDSNREGVADPGGK